MTDAALWLSRLAVVVVVALILWFGVGAVKDFIQAGPVAELEASRGNQAAAKKGIETQNTAVDGLKAAGEERQAKSAEAVKSAGKPEFAAAKRIQNTKAPGSTPIERSVNRINQELGL